MSLISNTLLLLYILLSYGFLLSASGGDPSHGVIDANIPNFIEPNPKYKPTKNNKLQPFHDIHEIPGDDDVRDERDDHDHDDENHHSSSSKNAKDTLEETLSKTKISTSPTLRFLKKHHTQITIALIIYAFRKELWNLLIALTTKPLPDGKGRVWKFAIHPTSILKIILFVDLMRKLQYQHQTTQSLSNDGTAILKSPSSIGEFFLQQFKGSYHSVYIPPIEQHYTFERLNDRYTRDVMAIQKASSGIPSHKQQKQQSSSSYTSNSIDNNKNATVILLDLRKLDSNRMDALNDEVSFLLLQHRLQVEQQQIQIHTPSKTNVSNLDLVTDHNASIRLQQHMSSTPCVTEIIILLESPGGSASDFGLAASHMGRLRDEPYMKVTICVDKVAASGGYMMACMASPGHLFAAPFAIVGSIGVLGQTVNIHNTLLNWGIQSLVFRGGKDKAPVGLVGEVTQEGIDTVQQMIDRAHVCFKRHVSEARPILVPHIDQVTTGDIFLGYDALELGLIDRLITSDEYIGEKLKLGLRVLKLIKYERPRFLFGSPIPMPLFPGARYHSRIKDRGLYDTIWKEMIVNTVEHLKKYFH